MRKALLALCALFFALALVACGNDSDGGGTGGGVSSGVSKISVSGTVSADNLTASVSEAAAQAGQVVVYNPVDGKQLGTAPIVNGKFDNLTIDKPDNDTFVLLFEANVGGAIYKKLAKFDLTKKPNELVGNQAVVNIVINSASTTVAKKYVDDNGKFLPNVTMEIIKSDKDVEGFSYSAGNLYLNGTVGDPTGATAAANPEQCAVCHATAGDDHQGFYDQFFKDGGIKVSNINVTSSSGNISITFNMTKNGQPFDCREADALSISWAPYTTDGFNSSVSYKGTLTYDGSGGCINTVSDNVSHPYSNFSGTVNGILAIYGADEIGIKDSGKHLQLAKYPFASIIKFGTVNYTSAANAKGCEKCHSKPYLKHGYIYGTPDNDSAKDFYVCKTCHFDKQPGAHYTWQLVVDQPELQAKLHALGKEDDVTTINQLARDMGITTDNLTDRYAYNKKLMNDVHMSHAMEFPYPQSMANCVTCHEGKLDKILDDSKFTSETCKSCHGLSKAKDKQAPALYDLMKSTGFAHTTPISNLQKGIPVTCAVSNCHDGNNAPKLKQLHSGYDDVIYDSVGGKYADNITVAIDNATFDTATNQITFTFKGSSKYSNLPASKIVPTAIIAMYGYDTKDFIVDPHSSNPSDKKRNLEFVYNGTSNSTTRLVSFTFDSSTTKWKVVADLSTWSSLIKSGAIRRVELIAIPTLKNADNDTLALNAPSRTFNIKTGQFEDNFYSPIVKVADGCNNCHGALATTFHTPDRGGNVVVCRACHNVQSGAAHLEMQSRSIDSYVHAIHKFQAFDIGSIKFDNATQAMEYDYHTETFYPDFYVTNCKSCHTAGSYNVPDQSKSMPGVLSKSSAIQGKTRNIGAVPMYVTGPASRACGSCHRAMMINEDDAGKLVSFNQHTNAFGYMIEVTDQDASGTVDNTDGQILIGKVLDRVMKLFQ